MIMPTEWSYVSELRPPTRLLFIPQVIYKQENHGGIMTENWFVHQSSLAIIPAESSSRKSGGTWRRKLWIWPPKYLCLYFEVISFTCCKILQHGADGFTAHPKEDVLRIFIALKNPSPRPGLDPRTFGRMKSTLTTAPPRRLLITINILQCVTMHTALYFRSNLEFVKHQVDTVPVKAVNVEHNNVWTDNLICSDLKAHFMPLKYNHQIPAHKTGLRTWFTSCCVHITPLS
jgi:hypothetical protein